MKNGWHIIKGFDCYIEDNKVMHCTKEDRNGNLVTAYPYKVSRYGGFDNATGVKVNTFKNDNYTVM